MARARVRVELDPARVNAMLREYAGASAKKGAAACREHIRSEITAAGRVDTGRMRSQISIRPVSAPGTSQAYSVAANTEYATFQDQGTRAHGPSRARFLVFRPKGSRALVFAKKVRGVTAARFMSKALARMRLEDYL